MVHLFHYLSFSLSLFIFSIVVSVFRFAVNVDMKEGKEWKEFKEVTKEDKELESNRPVSVMSSLSYRKLSSLDSVGSKADNLLKDSEDPPSFQKTRSKTSDLHDDVYSVSCRKTSQLHEDLSGRDSVVSQAYSEANSRVRRGLESRWSQGDKESSVSFGRPSTSLSFLSDCKPGSSLGLSGSQGFHRSASRSEEARGERLAYSSSPSSPCFGRRSRSRSPGSVSQPGSHLSLSRSRLSHYDVDVDDSWSVAFTDRSTHSPHSSTGRSVSMPPPQARPASEVYSVDDSDIKPVSHRSYLDPDLEKAINEVLSFKPIKFKRRSLEDSADENSKEDQEKSLKNGDGPRPTSSLRHSVSAVDCRTSSSSSSRSASSCSKKHSKSKKRRSPSSESPHSRHRSSSKRKNKKSKKRSQSSSSSSSSSSESESGSGSSSDASTISYRSSSSVKKAPTKTLSDPDLEEGTAEAPPGNKKEEKKRKKKVDSLMMKYLYRADSD